jgi:hypothetical protein
LLVIGSDYEVFAICAVISVINRYYDPVTGQFVSVDPMVNETDQSYLYAGDDPVNGVDPNGLDCGWFSVVCAGYDATAGAVEAVGSFIYRYSGEIAAVSSFLAAVTIEVPGVGEVFGAVAVAAGALSAERDIVVEHNLAAAVLDTAGTIAGAGSLGAEGLAALLRQASEETRTLGPVADWLAQDAASKEALSKILSRYGAALSAGSFSLNQFLRIISKMSGSAAAASSEDQNCG